MQDTTHNELVVRYEIWRETQNGRQKKTNGKNEEGKKGMDEVKTQWQAEHTNKRQ